MMTEPNYGLRNRLANLLKLRVADDEKEIQACDKLYEALQHIDYKNLRSHHGGYDVHVPDNLMALYKALNNNTFLMLHRYRLIVVWMDYGMLFVAPHNGDNIKYLFTQAGYQLYPPAKTGESALPPALLALHPRIGAHSSWLRAFGQHVLSDTQILRIVLEMNPPVAKNPFVMQDSTLRNKLFEKLFYIDYHDMKYFTVDEACQKLYDRLQAMNWEQMLPKNGRYRLPIRKYPDIFRLWQKTGFMHFFNFFGIVIHQPKGSKNLWIAPQHNDNMRVFFNLKVLCRQS